MSISLPDLDGLDVQAALANGPLPRPIIFLTGIGDVPSSVRTMKAGAIDFLMKPVDQDDLLRAIDRAGHVDAANGSARSPFDDHRTPCQPHAARA